MQTRYSPLEEEKDLGFLRRARVVPLRLLLILLMFLVLCLVFSFIGLTAVRKFRFGSVVAAVKPLCIGEDNTLDKWIRPPSNLMHNMSDYELFWRATFMPTMKKYPFVRTPKIAFMFLVKGPLPLAPLWERFFKGHEAQCSIYIHSLPSYSEEFPSTSVFYRRHVPSQLTEWGEMSMGDAERRLLANALLDISNEWFILVSESCIPIYNFSFIHQYIVRSKHSFIAVIDELGRDGRGRYNENMAPEVNLTEWRKGSQWFEVNRRLALTIVQDTLFYPKFKEFCRPNCYVDEHYLPTMLSIRAGHLLANRTLTWVDWSRGGAHPATYGKADISVEFFDKVKEFKNCEYNGKNDSACFLFVRKIAPSALEPLLKIASVAFGIQS